MARSRTTRSNQNLTIETIKEEVLDASQETVIDTVVDEIIEAPSEETAVDPKTPANIELTVSEEPQEPAPAADSEKIQTSVRERLSKKTPGDNPFVPSNPAALEKAAEQVAQEQGFTLNRGTSIGARLIARAQGRG